eukprot:CAMPEP_0172474752 /NCGR_PEP_ID=MMETSP1065-20121228/69519_1 /TAXON_ID=265537 /ORGANISM="Amphiprora paludosa, Strain CCMP125" /LENGTH=972 /DNA_ID=CAMNT_0013232941 /DNA_START=767 /DNA_END=3685 /DNA_ORIENTATION=+
MPSDEDIKAKEAARAGRANKPGAVTVAAEEAARLDQRIAEKLGDDGNVNAESSGASQLESLQADVMAKQAGRSAGGAASKPGAVSAGGSGTLTQLEQDITAKTNAASAPQRQLEDLESDVLSKRQGRSAAPAVIPGAVAEAPRNLESLESDVVAKQQGRVGGPAIAPGAVAATGPRNLESLESDIVSKQQGRPSQPASAPGAVASDGGSALSQLERDIMQKQGQNSGVAGTQLGQLEQDIVAKQGLKSAGPATMPGSVSSGGGGGAQLAQMEHDIAAKQSGTAAAPAAGPGALAAGGAQLTQLEQDVVAKSGAAGGVPATGPGARSELASLEDAVMRKNNAASTAAPAGQSGLASLEDSILRKNQSQGAGAPGRSNLESLEESVNLKVAGAGMGVAAAATGETTDLGQMEADVMAKNGGGFQNDSPLMKPGDDLKGPEPEQAPPKLGHDGGVDNPDVEYGVYDPEDNGLAVALPVTDEEEDAYIQSAVEYDPDAKPPIYRRRRFRLYAFLAFFALMAAAVGAVIGVVLSGNDDSGETVEQDLQRERIERLVGADAINDPASPYYKSLQWIKHNDTLQLDPADPSFVQRFVLAYLYYETTVDEPWRSCNPPEEGGSQYCTYLKLQSVAPESFSEIPWTRWLSDQPECNWAGISCDESGQVRSIDLNGQNLNGPFPEGLQYLPLLQAITMAWGSLSGTLPASFVELQHLVNIEMQYNDFTGPIPEEWWAARHMTRLNLASNKLSGTISPRIAEARDLRALYLQSNDIVGTMPTELGLATNLGFIYLNKNALTGPIPSEISRMRGLEKLYLQKNDLNGTIPESIGACTLMTEFRVNGQLNGKLGGEIPSSFYNLEQMIRFDLRDNKFTGSLDPRIAQMQRLLDLRISGNQMTGVLPSDALATIPDLRIFEFEGINMDITGTVTQALCDKRSQEGVQLVSLTANCKAAPDGFAEIECAELCCTTCCDPQGLDCEEG